MKAILVVTWFVYGQSPTTYQVPLASMEACSAARGALLEEVPRLKAEMDAYLAKQGGPSTPPKQVTTLCAPQ